MKFGEKIRKARISAGLSQEELAKAIGVSLRTVTNYETEHRVPRKIETYGKIAEALNIDVNYLMSDDEQFISDVSEKYGARGARQAKALATQLSGLFAGGELNDEDLDEMMKGIQEAFWIAKEKNRKYSPKKHRE